MCFAGTTLQSYENFLRAPLPRAQRRDGTLNPFQKRSLVGANIYLMRLFFFIQGATRIPPTQEERSRFESCELFLVKSLLASGKLVSNNKTRGEGVAG